MINLSRISNDHSYFLAVQHFSNAEERVELFTGRNTEKFHEARIADETEQQRYNFALWALMGLEPNDRYVTGIIVPYEEEMRKKHSHYPDAWVEFTMPEQYENAGERFVYDPLSRKLIPHGVWTGVCEPTQTARITQYEIVAKYFNPKYASIIRPEGACVFNHWDQMPKADKIDNDFCFITAALCEGYLTGSFDLNNPEDFRVDYFIARY